MNSDEILRLFGEPKSIRSTVCGRAPNQLTCTTWEDGVLDLREMLGAENMLLGSDWPHAEGLADPTEFARELGGFSDAEVKMVMRDNALGLSERRPL